MKLGRKFWLGLIGTAAIAVVGYVGGQVPVLHPFMPWIISWIGGVTGIATLSIAHEDSQKAKANAMVEAAKADTETAKVHAAIQGAAPAALDGAFKAGG